MHMVYVLCNACMYARIRNILLQQKLYQLDRMCSCLCHEGLVQEVTVWEANCRMQVPLHMVNAKCAQQKNLTIITECRSIDTPDAGNLLRAIIAAEPAVNPTRTQQPITLAMPPHVLDADVTEGANTMEMDDRGDAMLC